MELSDLSRKYVAFARVIKINEYRYDLILGRRHYSYLTIPQIINEIMQSDYELEEVKMSKETRRKIDSEMKLIFF